MTLQEYVQTAKRIGEYLANAISVEPSKLLVGDIRPIKEIGIPTNEIFEAPFLVDGQERAKVRFTLKYGVYLVDFNLIPMNNTTSYAPFSLPYLEGFKIVEMVAAYHIDRHPEFRELLRDLRENKRIPRQWLYENSEPIFSPAPGGASQAMIDYTFGTPLEDRLCIQVDKEYLKYVPEAEEQKDQQHSCIHGETVPYNPFETNPDDAPPLSVVTIVLQSFNDAGYSYLKGFSEGLPVPADGLEIVERKSIKRNSINPKKL